MLVYGSLKLLPAISLLSIFENILEELNLYQTSQVFWEISHCRMLTSKKPNSGTKTDNFFAINSTTFADHKNKSFHWYKLCLNGAFEYNIGPKREGISTLTNPQEFKCLGFRNFEAWNCSTHNRIRSTASLRWSNTKHSAGTIPISAVCKWHD